MRYNQVTIGEVAEKAGVSPGTVSRTIHNTGYIKQETREKIQQAIEELNYIPNRAGRTLKTTKTGLIMLAIPDTANAIYVGMIEAMHAVAQENEMSLVLYYTNGTQKGELNAVRMVREHLVDGLFLVNFHYGDELWSAIAGCGAPVVLCGMCSSIWAKDDAPFSTVSIDVYSGIYAATAKMVERGHKYIAYLGGIKDLPVYTQRFSAYRDVLDDNGIGFDEDVVFWYDYTKQHGIDAGRKIVRMHRRPTAIVASNDLQAIGAWTAVREAGLAVPRDVEICGMDNLEEMQMLSLPSINMREREVGKIGGEMIIEYLKDRDATHRHVSFVPELIWRDGDSLLV